MSDVFTSNQEVLVAHADARLNLSGRRLLVERVIADGRPVAHVAKELGVSRQCAHRWVARFRAEGEAGPLERSSRPRRCPRRTAALVERRVLQLRQGERRGQDWIGPEVGFAARTVSAILRRHQVPYLRECDPLTGQVIRTSKATAVRYEHDHPGSLVHMDVKKGGRIHDGGGWKANGREPLSPVMQRGFVGLVAAAETARDASSCADPLHRRSSRRCPYAAARRRGAGSQYPSSPTSPHRAPDRLRPLGHDIDDPRSQRAEPSLARQGSAGA